MNEVEYVLRIALRARDNMTRVLAKARAELAAFTKDVDKFDASVGKLNTRISRLNTRINNVTDKFAEWRTIMRDFGADTDKVGDATDKVAKKTDELAKKTGVSTKQHKDLQKAVGDLGNTFLKLDENFRSGKVSREDYIADLDRIGKEYDKLAKKSEIGSELGSSLRNAANIARSHITSVKETQAAEVRAVTEAAEAKAKAQEDAEKRIEEGRENRKNFALELLQAVSDREKQLRDNSIKLEKEAAQERIRIEAARQQTVRNIDSRSDQERAEEERAKQEAQDSKASEQQKKREQVTLKRLQNEIQQTRREYGHLSDEIERGNIRGETATGNLRTMASAFRRLGGDLRVSERERREFNDLSEKINTTLRKGETDVERYGGAHQRLGKTLGDVGENVGTMDNRLRGIGLFLAFSFAQQLTASLIGLGGELVAVASSAIMAAGAIGGNLTAGMSQAIPVAGLLAAGLQRVKQVIDAVQQANKLQQQQFVQGARDTEKAATDTDRLANANDSLKAAHDQASDAHDRLAEAQESQTDAQDALNEARDEAQQKIEDLILAEREAEQAAKGAALSQKEAQEALRQAVLTGDLAGIRRAQLAITDAQIDREKSLIDLRRQRADADKAVSGGVEGTEEVERAREQVENSRKGVEDANKAIDSANRGVQRARRGLDGAKRQVAETAGAMVTAQATLAYMLSQLSPAERRLYNALTRLQGTYRRIFIGDGTPGSGILGSIIDSFTYAVDKATEILQRQDVIDAATGLADEIAKQFQRITDAFTSDRSLGQFINITNNARENLGDVNSIIINLGKSFLNVAESADPAFKRLIEFIDRTVGRFLEITSNREGMEEFFLTGEEHLESWLRLLGAVANLILALTGAGAEQGLRTVKEFTDYLNNSADRIRDNRESVEQFFQDSSRVTRAIASVFATLAEELFNLFNPGMVERFANFLNTVFIPALINVIRVTSRVADIFARLAENPFIAGLMKWGLFGLLGLQVAASALGVFTYFARLTAIIKLFGGATRAASGLVLGLIGRLGALVTFLPGLRGLGGALGRIGGGAAAGGAARAGGAAAGGGLLSIFARRGTPGNPMHVFVVNQMVGGVGAAGGRTATNTAARTGRFAGARNIGAGAAGVASAAIGGAAGAALIAVPIVVIAAAENRARRAAEARGVGGRAEERFGEIANETPARLERIHDLFEKVRKKEELTTDELREWQNVMKRFGAEGQKEVDAVVNALDTVRDRTEKALDGLSDRVSRNLSRFSIKANDILSPNAINQVYSNFKRMRDSGVTSIQDLRKNIEFNSDKITEGLVENSDGWYDAVSGNLSATVAATVDAMDRQVISQRDGLREIRRLNRTTWSQIRDNVDNLSADARDAIAGNFASARRAIERQTGGWKKATGDALREIRKLMRQELELYGLSPAQARNIARGNRDRDEQFSGRGDRGPTSGTEVWGNRAEGGIVGGASRLGQRGVDAYRTIVGAGEMVLGNVHQRYIAPAVEAFYGHPLGKTFDRVRGIHAGIGRYVGDNTVGFAGGYAGRTPSGGRAVQMPAWATTGTPEFINARVLNEALALIKRFKLAVTDAFATSGHVGSGHLSTGTAVDVIPGAGGSWDLVDRAVSYARSRGLTVLYNGVAGHGRGHHAHIELMKGALGAMANVGADIRGIMRRIGRVGIGGPDSQLKNIGTAALENVKGAARRVMRRVARQMGVSPEGFEDVKGMTPDANVVQAFRQAIRRTGAGPKARMALWMAGIVESGLRNLARGDRDSVGSLQLRTGLHGRGLAMNPLMAAIAFLTRGFTGKGGAIDLARQFPRATAGQIAQMVQGSGFPHRYDQVRSQAQRYFAHGGIIPGWAGKAIGVVAHGGEWILNKFQQSRLARMLGTSASSLSSLLGFHGSVEKGAQGGLNTESKTVDLKSPRVTAIDRLGDITNLFLSIDELADRSNSAIGIIRRMIRETPKKIGRLADAFDVLTREGGILDNLRNAIDRRSGRRALNLTQDRFRVSRRGVVRERGLDESDVADRELGNLRKLRENLVEEQNIILRALRQAQRRLRRAGLTDAQKDKIRGQINLLRERLNDAQDRVAENVGSIFEAQSAAVQAEVEEINTNTERAVGRTDIGRRIAEALGRSTTEFDLQRIELIRNQAAQLQGPLARAKGQNNTALVNEIESTISELNASIVEATQAITQQAIEAINTNSQRRLGRLDLAERVLNATGTVGLAATANFAGGQFSRAGLFQQRGNVLAEQRFGLQGILRSQQMLPITEQNTAAIEDLVDQILELDVSIQENTRAAFQSRVEALSNATSFDLNIIDLNRQILELQGNISGNTDQAALLTNAQQRQNTLQGQRVALEQLLIDAQNASDQEAVNELTVALLENNIALLQNTQSINELTGATNEPQGFTTTAWQLFREAIFDGLGNILPQYNVFSPSQTLTEAGFFDTADSSSESNTALTTESSETVVNEGDTNINLYGYDRPVDPTEIAATVGFAKKTAQ